MQTLHVQSQIVEKVETDLTLKEMGEYRHAVQHKFLRKSAQKFIILDKKENLR